MIRKSVECVYNYYTGKLENLKLLSKYNCNKITLNFEKSAKLTIKFYVCFSCNLALINYNENVFNVTGHLFK